LHGAEEGTAKCRPRRVALPSANDGARCTPGSDRVERRVAARLVEEGISRREDARHGREHSGVATRRFAHVGEGHLADGGLAVSRGCEADQTAGNHAARGVVERPLRYANFRGRHSCGVEVFASDLPVIF